MQCPVCSEHLRDNVRYCRKCGSFVGFGRLDAPRKALPLVRVVCAVLVLAVLVCYAILAIMTATITW